MEKKETLSVMVSIVQGQLNEVFRRLPEDWGQSNERDNEGNNGIEEKIDGGGGGDGGEGGYYQRVESGTHTIEADGEGQCNGAVDREIADAQHKAHRVEPAYAASSKQAQQEYLHSNTTLHVILFSHVGGIGVNFMYLV
jgi:hypothetical protein